MPRYLLGIDNGGTVSKAALFDLEGHEVAAAGSRIETTEPRPGWVERDADALWHSTARAIRAVLAKADIDPRAIAAVACAGHGNGLYLVDERGQPTRPGIYSTDSRARDYVDAWQAAGVAEAALPLTTQCLWPGQPNAILAWLADHEPEALAASRWALPCKDFIRLRLTGEACGELTDMSGTSLLNVVTGDYDDHVLDLFGLGAQRRLLPPLMGSAEIGGYVTADAADATGLAEGTPVAGGMFDVDACGLAAGMVDERQMTLVAGTWGCNLYIDRAPLCDPDLFMTSCYSIPGWYLMLEGSPTSAANLEWFIQEWLGDTSEAAYDAANALVETTDPRDSELVFAPFLYGSNAGPNAKAALVGLEARHTRADVLRAVYEGVVFAHHWHVQRLLAFREPPECIRFTGGAARSAVWVQMFADTFGVPVELPAGSELGALGAAIAAAVACGIQPDLPTAVAAMTRVTRRFEPNPDLAEVYQAKYARARAAIDAVARL